MYYLVASDLRKLRVNFDHHAISCTTFAVSCYNSGADPEENFSGFCKDMTSLFDINVISLNI